nr:hypothetical protein [Amycolatopsis sp. MtRt-6]
MQNVFFERLRRTIGADRDGPNDVATVGQPARLPFRTTNGDKVTIGFPCPNATIDVEFFEPRQGKKQIGDIAAKFIEKGSSIDTILQRQPDFGVEAGRNVGGGGPRKPQDGNVPVGADGVPGAFGGEDDTPGGGGNARLIGDGPHGGEPDAEAPDGIAGLAGGPQRRERGDTPRVERGAGVGEPEFGVHKGHPNPPRSTRGHGGIGGVLGKFDEEPIPIGTNTQIAFDVGVFGEPRGRVPPGAQGGLTKPRGPEGIGRLADVGAHRSGESSIWACASSG